MDRLVGQVVANNTLPVGADTAGPSPPIGAGAVGSSLLIGADTVGLSPSVGASTTGPSPSVGASTAGSSAPIGASTAGTPLPTWPSETNLYFTPDLKLSLSLQTPLVCLVVQDAIANLRVSMCIVDAFPVGAAKAALLRGLLLRSAKKYEPSSASVLERLLQDSDYMATMLRLVRFVFLNDSTTKSQLLQPRARVPIFRGEPKSRCDTIIFSAIAVLGSREAIKNFVMAQTNKHNYIFPSSTNVSTLSVLT